MLRYGIVFVLLVSRLAGQATVVPVPLNAGPSFGEEASALGDVDNDGVVDFVLCEPGDGTGPPRIWVISGATLEAINSFVGQGVTHPTAAALGMILRPQATGDVDGNGVPDLLTVDGVYDVIAGALVTPMSAFPAFCFLPRVMKSVGDVDSDGLCDIAFVGWINGCPATGGTYAIHVCSGAGPLLYSVPILGGSRIVIDSVGDVDIDGCDDFIVGVTYLPEQTFPGAIDPGHVEIVSGQLGATIFSSGAGSGSFFGSSVCGAGDLDGDGVPDALVAAPHGPTYFGLNSLGAKGEIWVISGATLTMSLVWECPYAFCGASDRMYCVDDVDGDGFSDVLFEPSAGVLISMRTASTIDDSVFANCICTVVGDITGDGVVERLLGQTPGNRSDATLPAIDTLVRPNFSIFGASGCVVTPVIGISGEPTPVGSVTINASSVPDDVPAFLMIGGSNANWGARDLPFSVSMFGIGGCDVLVSPDLVASTFTTSIGNKAFASLTFPLPNDPAIVGLTRYAQWYVTTGGNGPGALSAAVAIAFE